MEDNPLGDMCKGVVDISKCNVVRSAKNGKSHVMTLQMSDYDSKIHFDFAAESLEDLFEWYQVAWDITQREITKQHNKQLEATAGGGGEE
ncbi:unnamed protein product [Oncorhynchus mykiss]|uniref:PH domain-containing protein n=1 Tax=Oncorhynchus mykiss TaxID=8022 RepID=A0A060WBI3_ONCMY|nr:unnamed protein product [Oncorhynchus mykiss]